MPARAGDRDDAILERLAEGLEHGAWELGKLVEQEHAPVRESYRRLSRVGGNLQSSDASSKRAISPSSPPSGTGRSGWRVATQATPRSG